MMESENRNVAATNDSVDSEGAEYGEPSNLQSEEHLRFLLTSLDKGQLVDILVMLGMKIPQAAEEIRGVRPTASNRKLIVHGFGEETTSEALGDAFSSYGEVEDAYVEVDSATGQSRCFGFITFKNMESVKKALETHNTWVDGRRAHQRRVFEGAITSAYLDLRKLYVARISPDITTEMFLRFFEKYGEIVEGSIIYDTKTETSRGFGFVTFKTADAAKAAITDPDKILGRNRISVSLAQRRFKRKEIQAQEPVTYAPHTHISPYAIAPQHYGSSQSQVHPHFSGYEPYGMPPPFQPPSAGFIAYPYYFS